MYRSRLEKMKSSSAELAELRSALLDFNDLRTQKLDTETASALSALAQWQQARLIESHQDLYTNSSYRPGLDFLFGELYGPKDFSQRDQDLERIAPKLTKFLPKAALGTLTKLVQLNLLTQQLDLQCARQLKSSAINATNYVNAFRTSSTAEQRLQQLELVREASALLTKYTQSQTVRFAVKLSKKPAEMAGLTAMHNFVEDGFRAFENMNNVQGMINTVIEREQKILHNIYSGSSQPFNWS